MRTRRFAALSLVVLALAGCGNDGAPSPAPSGVARLSAPSPEPTETISGTVSAGVEPHCLILQDSKGSHVLFFPDASLKASAPAGSEVTLVGQPQPRMMTICQQGVPFIVSSVRKG
jgi:hypothetical protein